MFTLTSPLGRVARALGLLALVAALFSGFALTTPPASAGPALGAIAVHVTSTDGAFIEKALVRLYNQKGTNVAKAETDGKGNAAFKIEPGIYKVFVKSDTYAVVSIAAEVVAGQEVLVNVTLQSNATTTSGAPIAPAVALQPASTTLINH